mmetsp:Transcript_19598/g.64815  ORF Transcript_19598/g.64815 Transcript_19598/m.64815 type:complete len:310 (+) Transcript_19598:40-969(+)
MLHLEPGHRIMAEALAARIHAPPDRREAVDVRCSDFGVQYYLCVPPEQQNVLKLSVWVRCFAEVVEGVGEAFFAEQLYPGMVQPPEPGYSLTLALDLDALPPEEEARNELVRKLSCVGRDVLGAPLRVVLLALLGGAAPPRPYYAVHHREGEAMYVVPKDDVVIVVFGIAFASPVEAAIAKAFLHEIEISRRQSRDLATAPTVSYTHEPPLELKQLDGVRPLQGAGFVGHVSLALSKRNVEGGRLEKVLALVVGYRNYLMFHVMGAKSQLHTRIRSRSSNWLQVLNRAMPEKLDKEKKTITGRTFRKGP